ncbi:unnamed protein product [Chilo suppressalis]|uniref:Uncharacterized protein n=1 Tax=Chilo suppressalis TaxID=168631 RepID=A0ABN8L971_CHISP|nr:unnamed protein product [Chilo suppressalis]
MRSALLILTLLAYQPCHSRPAEEESVVSVYTTQGTTSGTHPPLDVYHQIANNIAERITSPIYRFLGLGKNKTVSLTTTTKHSWEKIEILDDGFEEATKSSYLPVDNDISRGRDVEELSVQGLRKSDVKPEKLTLYSSYLPVKSNLENLGNDTNNDADSKSEDDDDDGLTLDDVNGDDDGSDDNIFYYFLELLGSLAQLLWGSISAVFNGSSSNNNSS